jgi:hypothetical protein
MRARAKPHRKRIKRKQRLERIIEPYAKELRRSHVPESTVKAATTMMLLLLGEFRVS